MKTFNHVPYPLWGILLGLQLTIGSVKAQIFTNSYLSAAERWEKTANQTKCADKRAFCLKVVACLRENARQMQSGGNLSSCNFGAEPVCPADSQTDFGSSGNNAGTNGNDPVAAVLANQAQMNNAIDAGSDAMKNHLENGGKASGGLLRGAIVAASQAGSAKASLGALGIGGGMALIAKMSEANKERKEAEQLQQERAEAEEKRVEEKRRLEFTKKQGAILARVQLVNDQLAKVRPPSISEQIPSYTLSQDVKVLYYLPFAYNNEHRNIFDPWPIWVAFAPVILHRNADNTWPFMNEIKEQIMQKCCLQHRIEIDLQLLGPFVTQEGMIKVRDEIVLKTHDLDALNLLRFVNEPLSFGAKTKATTNFWGDAKATPSSKDATKPANSAKSFWNN